MKPKRRGTYEVRVSGGYRTIFGLDGDNILVGASGVTTFFASHSRLFAYA